MGNNDMKAYILEVGTIDPFNGWTFCNGQPEFVYNEQTGDYEMTCGWELDELRIIAQRYGENTRHSPPLDETALCNETKYGLLSDNVWWQWIEHGKFTDRLSLPVAQEACAMLNMAAQPGAHWKVKIIGDNGLAVDLSECYATQKRGEK